ncbi:hypothetical protein B0T25DRAFT_571989 [Lasiosphaeria hispida]|uniref:Uncharacterized protein n=1 Tax=Lasiosphaeria hispida TaxID=260671 RepID=A0AAJ0HC64_9PEZI|nr:hypothetical protein B0T25DRAFT_571989 [Lasiosphaeria hispida]
MKPTALLLAILPLALAAPIADPEAAAGNELQPEARGYASYGDYKNAGKDLGKYTSYGDYKDPGKPHKPDDKKPDDKKKKPEKPDDKKKPEDKGKGYGSYGEYKPPAGGYGSYGEYKPPAGGYGSYGAYKPPAGGYGSYGHYKRVVDGLVSLLNEREEAE